VKHPAESNESSSKAMAVASPMTVVTLVDA
jgi:hypothetical protein